MGFPPEGSQAEARGSDFQERIPQNRERVGRNCASSRRSVRVAAPRPPLLQFARRRRRRTPGSREKYLLFEQRPGAYGAVAEAVRMHAVDAVGWRAVGRGFEL